MRNEKDPKVRKKELKEIKKKRRLTFGQLPMEKRKESQMKIRL